MRVEWSLAALSDLENIQAYLEEESPRAAARMWTRIHERVALQSLMPRAAPMHRSGPSRMLVVSGTPYLVFYVVEADVLRVEQVVHSAQNR